MSRGRSPLPFLASLAAATAALSPRGGSPARCLRSVPRSGARTAAALDFGRINFEVWEPCGSHGSSSYSPPPPPPPPVRRCRRGCPSPAARSAPRRRRASLSARTFPTAAFLPGPHFFFFFFFVKVRREGGGGRAFPSPSAPLPFITLQVAGELGRLPRPVPSRPVHPPGGGREETMEGGREGWRGRPGRRHKLPLPVAVPARLLRGSHGRQRPLGCTPLSPIATSLPAPPHPAAPRRRLPGGLSSSGPLRLFFFILFFIFFKCWWQMGPCALLGAVPHRPLRGVGWGGLGSEAGMSERDFLLMPPLQPV